MTEDRAIYHVEGMVEIRPSTLLPFGHPDYQQPTGDEVRTVTRMAGMSGSQVATFVGKHGSRHTRKWISGEVPIPYACWRLLVLRAGLVGVEDVVDAPEAISERHPTGGSTKRCPICAHAFKGNGWDGIDSHWKAHHLDVCDYASAWQIIKGMEQSAA